MRNRKLLNVELGRISPDEYKSLADSRLVVVLDNIRSAHNVGSVFRTSDAFGIGKVLLCGICATPPSAEIHKSALGAEDSVPWAYFSDTADAVRRLKEDGYTIISVEQTVGSVSLEKFTPAADARYAFIFGNEVDGVRQDVVDMSDLSLEIPQWGVKHSLNISVSAGVVLWHIKSLAVRGR